MDKKVSLSPLLCLSLLSPVPFFYRHLLGFISVGEVIAKILRIVNYYLFIYLFIYYLIAFIMITVLKKTREKTHLNKTQKRGTKVRDTQQSEASN